MIIPKILIGVLILVAGQKFFWFFIGALGFLAGSDAALSYSLGMPYWQILVIGLICGLLGLALAVFLEGMAIISAGFLAGVYIFFNVWNIFNLGLTDFWWIYFLASGITGSVLLVIFFNPALIFISSFIGAMLIVQSTTVEPFLKLVLFSSLLIIGVLIQSKQLKTRSPKNSSGTKQVT